MTPWYADMLFAILLWAGVMAAVYSGAKAAMRKVLREWRFPKLLIVSDTMWKILRKSLKERQP